VHEFKIGGGGFVNMRFRILCFLAFLTCSIITEAVAAPSVTIAPAADNIYVIQGNDFSGVSGVDLTVRYDAAALASPVVVQGSFVGGALMAVNAATPGMVRLALVRVTEIKGTGAIATMTFTRLKSTGADIQSLSALVLAAGKNTPVPAQIVNAPKKPDAVAAASTDTQQTGQTAGGSSSDTSSSPVPAGQEKTAATTQTAPPAIVGIVVPASGASIPEAQGSVPSTSQPAAEVQQPVRDAAAPPESVKEAPKETVVAKAVEPERKKVMLPGVLERFKEFKGEKTPAALMALFSVQDKGLKQDPPIVLSNGKALVTIVLELDSKGESNNFLLDGVSLVSLKNKEKNSWLVELLPDLRTYEATISVPRKDRVDVLPLTIAPPMDVNIDSSASRLTEADFKLFLKDKGTDKAPRFDLNRDGRRDYIDDFIFTANYLVQRDSPDKQGTPARK
jgi:hypothetical protein